MVMQYFPITVAITSALPSFIEKRVNPPYDPFSTKNMKKLFLKPRGSIFPSTKNDPFGVHKDEWVTEDGVHTNTVEGTNFMVKKRLVCEGGSLGRIEENRKERLRAVTEKCNGSIRKRKSIPLVRVFSDLNLFC